MGLWGCPDFFLVILLRIRVRRQITKAVPRKPNSTSRISCRSRRRARAIGRMSWRVIVRVLYVLPLPLPFLSSLAVFGRLCFCLARFGIALSV